MTTAPIVLLPGLDGTGELFEYFVATAPAHVRPLVVSFPHHTSYEDLSAAIRSQLPATGSFAVLGESFSGPLAIALAEETAERVSHVVLCSTFVSSPVMTLLRVLPWSVLFRFRPPRWLVRYLLVGEHATSELVEAIRAAITKTPSYILAGRLRSVFRLQECRAASVRAPVLLLVGEHDRLIRSATASFRRIARDLTVEVLPGPHLLMQVNPVGAWKAIERFLRQPGRETRCNG